MLAMVSVPGYTCNYFRQNKGWNQYPQYFFNKIHGPIRGASMNYEIVQQLSCPEEKSTTGTVRLFGGC